MQERSQLFLRPMPPPQGTNPYQDILNQLEVEFGVEPSTIPICTTSQSVQFRWRVTGPDVGDPNIHLTLAVGPHSFSVGPVGSQLVQYSSPIDFPIAYAFSALYQDQGGTRAARTFEIGFITASPDPNAIVVTVDNAKLAEIANPQVRRAAADILGNYAELKGDPNWSILPDGIHGLMHFAVPPNSSTYVFVAVRLTLVPILDQGRLRLVDTDFSASEQMDPWTCFRNPELCAIVGFVINTIIIPVFKPQLADLMQQVLNDVVLVQPRCPIRQVQLQVDQMVLTLCCPQ